MSKTFIKNRFEGQEARDYMKFAHLANRYSKKFNLLTATTQGCIVDAISLNITGGTYAIELKERFKMYDDAYIEVNKFKNMLDLWFENKIVPLYVNFYGEDTYIWDLRTIEDKRFHPNVKITSQDGDTYIEDRYGLYFEDATIITPDKMTRPYNYHPEQEPACFKDKDLLIGRAITTDYLKTL